MAAGVPAQGKGVGIGPVARSGHPVGVRWGLVPGTFCFCLKEAGARGVGRRWPRYVGRSEASQHLSESFSTHSLSAPSD